MTPIVVIHIFPFYLYLKSATWQAGVNFLPSVR